MLRRPPRSTRTDTRFPYPTLFRSRWSIGHDHATLAPVPIMEDGKTRHVSISLILATQECCPIPGLDDLEAIVKQLGHRQCSLGAPFPILNQSVIDADKPAGRLVPVTRLCDVDTHLVAGNYLDPSPYTLIST